MSEFAEFLTAIAALIAALTASIAAIGVLWTRRKAAEAAEAALAAKRALVEIDGAIFGLGERIDGRLSELLKAETGKARAEGIAQGEQAQRDRAAEAQL